MIRPISFLPTNLRDKVSRWTQFKNLNFQLSSGLSDADVFSFFMQSSMSVQIKQRFIKNLGFYSLDSLDGVWVQKKNRDICSYDENNRNDKKPSYTSILFETEVAIGLYSSNPYKHTWEPEHASNKKMYVFIDNNDLSALSSVEGIGADNHLINKPYEDVGQISSNLLIKKSRHRQITAEDDVLINVVSLALEQSASDIHFYSVKTGYDIFLRVKGSLIFFKRHSETGFDQRLKFKSNMDISIYNVAQDGRLSLDLSRYSLKGASERLMTVDLRVSSYPSFYGENFVLRLFSENREFDINSGLGFNKNLIPRIKKILKKQSGLFLVTGPTGSGKTTTLYGFMNWIVNQGKQHIISIEDPVEALIPGVQQSQVHKGFGFSDALKSMLRQDPDVIILGEIRDASTAKIAIEAAYTGHLVFATLHTSDCWSAISRLKSFGLDLFLINHCLLGVLSQQLVQLKCSCNSGCNKCEFSMVKKRQPIHELLILNHNDFNQIWVDESAFESHFFHRFKDDIFAKQLGKELNTEF